MSSTDNSKKWKEVKLVSIENMIIQKNPKQSTKQSLQLVMNLAKLQGTFLEASNWKIK